MVVAQKQLGAIRRVRRRVELTPEIVSGEVELGEVSSEGRQPSSRQFVR